MPHRSEHPHRLPGSSRMRSVWNNPCSSPESNMPGWHATPSFLFLRNRPLLVTSPTKLKQTDFNEVEDILGRPYSNFGWGQMTAITSSTSQRLLRQIPLATDKLLSQHPPPSGEPKSEETKLHLQAVIVTRLPLALDLSLIHI